MSSIIRDSGRTGFTKLKRRVPPRARKRLLETLDPARILSYRLKMRTTEAIPPVALRDVVGGTSINGFIQSGRACADAVHRALSHIGRSLGDFGLILEFGCGCGRTLRHIYSHHPDGVHACDVNQPAIEWLRRHYPEISCDVNGFSPPLPYADASFDLVYAISVFTHLDEESQQEWLSELARVVRPGGVALLSIHGDYAFELFRSGDVAMTRRELDNLRSRRSLAEEGFVYEEYEAAAVDPLFTHARTYGLSFQSGDYTKAKWSGDLRVRAILPRLVDSLQDMVVLQRPNEVQAREA